MTLSRRTFIAGVPLVLAGCTTSHEQSPVASAPRLDVHRLSQYAAIDTEPFPVPAVDLAVIDPQFLRQVVHYPSPHRPGTIVVDLRARFAFWIQEENRALRYGIGVGKEEGLNFQGEATIARKAKWPRWRPTDNMIAREPERYGPFRDGLPGGSGNPLGPRALYLYRDGRDTYYRLHGTVEPWTIGTMVSSGCIRLLNQDIIDLYQRVPTGTKVVVMSASSGA
jgi:lipoprotein-anchoring transpeptidase ErfK/SrfK